ncbi:MAG: alpha/beta fold hydrolase [Chloroflexi bacterium]|nr:alpha/beta fold hydrolase [Chloroflexota bacterium]
MEDLFVDTGFGVVFGKAVGPENGRLILGIHGYSQRNGWHTWEPMMAPLAEAGFRVVSVDMPGWGQSVSTQGQVSGESAVATVLQLLDGLDAETAVLMGKSWGGNVAVETAVSHPNRIAHLILTAPAVRNTDMLARLTQPVLLAWAEDDPVIPYQYAGQMAAAIPHCQLETYPTGGHSAAPKNAADFAPKAIEFLKRKT